MNDRIDWQSIVTFEAVARLGTFTLAAEELNVLQPSVSRRIARLEAELGTHLFFRTRPRVTLTGAGENLLHASQGVIAQMSEALAAIKHRPIESPLVVNTTIGFASNFLLSRLNEFSLLYPDYNIEIISRDVNDEYVAEDADLVTMFGRESEIPGFTPKLIRQEEMIAVADPRYLHKHQETGKSPQHHRFLHLVSGGYANDWSIFLEGRGFETPEPNTNQNFTSYMVYLHAALNSQGVMLGQRFMLQEYLDSGALEQVFPWSKTTDRGYFICLTHRGIRHEPAKRLAEWLAGSEKTP